MNRELPTHELKDTLFEVDVYKMELREKANPSNVISFLHMEDRRTHYEMEYDPTEKNLVYNTPFFRDEDHPENYVNVPQMKDLDPQGMAEKYGKTMEEISASCDYELMVGQHPLQERMERGRLPVIDIEGHPFYADMRLGKLRPKDDFSTMGIDMSQVYDHSVAHHFLYHIPTKTEFFPNEVKPMTTLPEDVVLVMVPGPARLDPVGLANRYVKNKDTYLETYPLILYSKATSIPLAYTEVAEHVKFNCARMELARQLSQQQHQQQQKPDEEKKNKPRLKR
jgi:hypothetical protein